MSKWKTEAAKAAKKNSVKVVFRLTPEEAERVCALRHEPKVSTAAAQIVRMAID